MPSPMIVGTTSRANHSRRTLGSAASTRSPTLTSSILLVEPSAEVVPELRPVLRFHAFRPVVPTTVRGDVFGAAERQDPA